jgi:large subunit GTPase 1
MLVRCLYHLRAIHILTLSGLVARGFARAGQGNPDESRAARYILKDYVNAKLLFCHPPPGQNEDEFNDQTRERALERAAGKKRAPITRVVKGADTFVSGAEDTSGSILPAQGQGKKSRALDQEFFQSESGLSARPFVKGSARDGREFSRTTLYPHQNAVADDGSALTGRRARIAAVLASAGADSTASSGKKHHKKPKRVKQRSGKGYE